MATNGKRIAVDEARQHLENVLASAGFRRSKKSSRFLVMLAEAALSPNPYVPDERMVAREVFLRPYEFDPKLDSIVRVEAGRLRARLAVFAEGAGRNAPVILTMVPGSYRIEFSRNPRIRRQAVPLHLHATTPNADAYSLYFQAWRSAIHFLPEELEWSLRVSERLTADHPGYALSHVGEAEALLLAVFAGVLRPLSTFPRIAAAIERALEIDPLLAPAHGAAALLCLWSKRDPIEALALADRALALGQPSAHLYLVRAACLVHGNRLEEAVRVHHQAIGVDPTFPPAYAMASYCHFYARQFEEAEKWGRAALRLDPTLEQAHFFLGLQYLSQGRVREAVLEARACDPSTRSSLVLGLQGACLAASGKTQEARAVIKALQKKGTERYVDPVVYSLIWMLLPNGREQAIGALEKAVAEYSPCAYRFPLSPVFDPLGDDVRVRALARSLKIPNLVYPPKQRVRNAS